jgi:hypothetical protein
MASQSAKGTTGQEAQFATPRERGDPDRDLSALRLRIGHCQAALDLAMDNCRSNEADIAKVHDEVTLVVAELGEIGVALSAIEDYLRRERADGDDRKPDVYTRQA